MDGTGEGILLMETESPMSQMEKAKYHTFIWRS